MKKLHYFYLLLVSTLWSTVAKATELDFGIDYTVCIGTENPEKLKQQTIEYQTQFVKLINISGEMASIAQQHQTKPITYEVLLKALGKFVYKKLRANLHRNDDIHIFFPLPKEELTKCVEGCFYQKSLSLPIIVTVGKENFKKACADSLLVDITPGYSFLSKVFFIGILTGMLMALYKVSQPYLLLSTKQDYAYDDSYYYEEDFLYV